MVSLPQVHAIFYLLKIHFNIILPSMSGTSKWSLSLMFTPYSIYWRPTSILSSHLCLGLPNGLFPSQFPAITLYASPPPSYVSHAPPIPYNSSRFNKPNIWWVVQFNKLQTMQSSPVPRYIVSLSPKCLPQHPILEHPSAHVNPPVSKTKVYAHIKQ